MQVQLTFRQMNATGAIQEQVFREADRIERAYPQQIAWCHLVVERPDHHRANRRPYGARVAVEGRLGYFVASTDPGAAFDSPHAAITAVFEALHDQLCTRSQRRHDSQPAFSY